MQANIEKKSYLNKGSQVEGRKQNLTMPIILLIGAIIVCSALFLTLEINAGSTSYALSKRIPKLMAIVVTGACIGYSTIIFQTITDNRILTPSIMGIDSLYVSIQTIIIFAFGSASVMSTNRKRNFLICVVFMVIGSLALYRFVSRRENANIMFALLVGMICGTFF